MGGRVLAVGLAALLVLAANAGAATLEVRYRWVAEPGTFGEPVQHEDVVFDGQGSEVNQVTVAADPTAQGVVFTDPMNPIHVAATSLIPGVDPLSPALVHPTWGCAAVRRSVAACAAEPGVNCDPGGCSPDAPGSFYGLIKVAGNDGDDTITIKRIAYPAIVWGVGGDDVIDVANKIFDHVDCGPGNDTVTADPGDAVAASCETVSRRSPF